MASWVRDLHGKVEASMVEYVGDACDLVDTNLNFEALLHKHSCWASDVALHRFLELLREALIQSPNATCFYGTAGAENGLLVDVFETIQQTQSKEFPQVEDDFQNDVEKNVTHYFCLPFLQSFFDVAQSTGEWAPLIANFTLYTKSLTNAALENAKASDATARYRAKRWTTNSIETSENSCVSIYALRHVPDGLVVDRTMAQLNRVTARYAMLAFDLKRSIEKPGLFYDAQYELTRHCLYASRDGAVASVETPVLIGVVGDGANWRFEVLHIHLPSESAKVNDNAAAYVDVKHTLTLKWHRGVAKLPIAHQRDQGFSQNRPRLGTNQIVLPRDARRAVAQRQTAAREHVRAKDWRED
jgi:hypothetical protein